MRSIRRSLLGYLLVLLAAALGAVGVLVDRVTTASIRARESSEVELIERTYRLREQEASARVAEFDARVAEARSRIAEAKRKFDAGLLDETKARAGDAHRASANILGQNQEQPRRLSPLEWTVFQAAAAVRGQNVGARQPSTTRFPEAQPPVRTTEEEARLFRLRVGLMELVPPPAHLPRLVTLAALEPRVPGGIGWGDPRFNDPHRYNPFPGWIEYETPRVFARFVETLGKTFEEDDHTVGFQITAVGTPVSAPLVGANGIVLVPLPAHIDREPVELPLASGWIGARLDSEPKFDDVDVPGKGKFRRVTTSVTANGRPLVYTVWLPPPPPITAAAGPPRLIPRGPHLVVRLYVQVVRPYPAAEPLPTHGPDNQWAVAREARDTDLARVRTETQVELAQFRARLVLIGAGTFAALVLGGWFLVSRGLVPLRTLSEAVSRVSEKDFRLPVRPEQLGRELLPVHARLTQTLTLLQRAFAREKQAVADISHELRTPIASLLATIDVALRKPRTTDQYRATLEECRLISKQLGQLVERIMTLASLDAGNDHGTPARVDGAELAAECAAVIRPLAAANELTLTTRLDGELPLHTDVGKLREVLMNLLHNAVEYNRPNGTIELIVRRVGNSAVFEVRDTGIGMGPEVQERIFERFFRADASRHATGVHAGLGLAIVKEYIARLNGTIAVESAPGDGTTFRVTLPAIAQEEVGPPTPRSSARGALPTAS